MKLDDDIPESVKKALKNPDPTVYMRCPECKRGYPRKPLMLVDEQNKPIIDPKTNTPKLIWKLPKRCEDCDCGLVRVVEKQPHKKRFSRKGRRPYARKN